MNIKRSLYKRFSIFADFILSIADITDLSMLSYNIPVLKTKENCEQNDYYGHAYNLKKYCGLPTKYPLKCVIEHGIYNRLHTWDCDINNNMPVILSIGEYRKDILSKKCNKKHFAIGPYIHYVNPSIPLSQINKEKEKLGKTLLVFPSHSTHHVDTNYDINLFCEEILKIKNLYNFKTVRICLYWKDIINGYEKIYIKYGFECVSAGHIFDKYFLSRLKSIILMSDVTMSNSNGTHVGYCLYLNKPHYIWKQEINYTGDNIGRKEINEQKELSYIIQKEKYEFEKQFSSYSETISEDQKKAIEQIFSFSKVKTKEQLTQIFNEAENLYYNK